MKKNSTYPKTVDFQKNIKKIYKKMTFTPKSSQKVMKNGIVDKLYI